MVSSQLPIVTTRRKGVQCTKETILPWNCCLQSPPNSIIWSQLYEKNGFCVQRRFQCRIRSHNGTKTQAIEFNPYLTHEFVMLFAIHMLAFS